MGGAGEAEWAVGAAVLVLRRVLATVVRVLGVRNGSFPRGSGLARRHRELEQHGLSKDGENGEPSSQARRTATALGVPSGSFAPGHAVNVPASPTGWQARWPVLGLSAHGKSFGVVRYTV